MMTPARTLFLNKMDAHFRSGRRATNQVLCDIERELIADGFTEEELDRAARDMLRTRERMSFPSLAECVRVCHRARAEMKAERQTDTDAPSARDLESGQGIPESRSRPSRSADESNGVPVKAAVAA